MSDKLDFLTASGEALQTWFMSGESGPTLGQAVVNLRDQTAAAAEAKVRGECAAEIIGLRDHRDSMRHSLAITQDNSNIWQRRAERETDRVVPSELHRCLGGAQARGYCGSGARCACVCFNGSVE
jgi:hypothetical protein